jgi:intein-encoded DNA endonuclease-like protein
MKKIKLSNDVLQEIILLYHSGLSCHKVGKQFSYSGEFIRTTLMNNNIFLRKYCEINRKHTVKEDFFDVIDCEEKAYFLGMLFSDGNVKSKHNTNAIVLKLQKDDKELLSRLSCLVLGKEKLYVSEDNLVLQFSSKNMKQKLIELGCVPAKSLILKYPQIDKQFSNHFIRGYFDGDGSIFSYKNDFTVSLVSTDDFCRSAQDIIYNNIGILGKITKDKEMLSRGNNITSIMLFRGNRQILRLMDWLYQDATIYMERKYQKYQELRAWTEDVDSRLNSPGNHKNQYV